MRPAQSALTDLEHVRSPVCHKLYLPLCKQPRKKRAKKSFTFWISIGNQKKSNFRAPWGVSWFFLKVQLTKNGTSFELLPFFLSACILPGGWTGLSPVCITLRIKTSWKRLLKNTSAQSTTCKHFQRSLSNSVCFKKWNKETGQSCVKRNKHLDFQAAAACLISTEATVTILGAQKYACNLSDPETIHWNRFEKCAVHSWGFFFFYREDWRTEDFEFSICTSTLKTQSPVTGWAAPPSARYHQSLAAKIPRWRSV